MQAGEIIFGAYVDLGLVCGCLQVSAGFCECLWGAWVSVGVCGCLWMSVGVCGCLWVSVGVWVVCGCVRVSVGLCECLQGV